MAYASTIFNQLLTFVPKQHFNAFVGQHNSDKYVKKLTTWNQFIALLYAQATGKESLRDIQTGFSMHTEKWAHLGIQSVARSSLSYANNRRDYRVFEKLFYEILTHCKEVSTTKEFSFSNPLYSLDSTTIRLCLSLFDWAKYTKTKGALKLHTLLDNGTMMPEVVVSSDGKKGDITAAKEMELHERLENGSVVVFDRAYIDYRWWKQLNDNGIFFVSRTKVTTTITVLGQHSKVSGAILEDSRAIIGEHSGYEKYPNDVRYVKFVDKDTGKIYEYVTNNFSLSANQIVEIYKARWQIELFFKWIKQNLKIKTFLGISENAVLTQIWVAMTYYLLLSYIKFQTKFNQSLLELTRMIREVLFVHRNLIDMLSLDSTTIEKFRAPPNPQLALF
jgi:hypothetical protein